ncbi:MAG: hypothetical protein MI757_02340, partial [Pirellulales bacterium]|nr:hypothetical protein [Pirellulales bacterium]
MSRRLRRWFVAILLLVVVIWIAPWIVAATSLRNTVLASIFSDVRGTIRCKSASFGWFSPVVLSDLTIVDEQGVVIGRAAHVESSKSLLALATDSSSLGTFTIRRPQVDVVFDADTTNIEKVFHEWIYGDSEGAVGITVVVEDGTLRWADDQMQLASLTVVKPLAADEPLQVNAAAETDDQGRKGTLDFALSMKQTGSEGTASIKSEAWSLAVLRRFIHRFGDGSRFGGIVSGTADFTWAGSGKDIEIQADLEAQDFTATSPWLRSDRVKLARLDTDAKLTMRGNTLDIERLSVNSDLGSASAAGQIPLAWSGWRQLVEENLTIQGNLDLVQLAKLLPQSLRI